MPAANDADDAAGDGVAGRIAARETAAPSTPLAAAPPPPPPPLQAYMLPTMLGSATAGALARLPLHPIDTCKARLQVQRGAAGGGGYTSLLGALAGIARTDGVLRGLYRGFGVTLVGSAPAAMLYFTSYELARERLPALVPGLAGLPAPATHFLAGMAAEAASCVLWVPIDVIKERMQVQARPPQQAASAAPQPSGPGRPPPAPAAAAVYYTSTADAVRKIWRGEGLLGLYRGYGATLASFGPFSALYFVFYERLKAAAQRHVGGSGPQQQLPFEWQVATACAAGGAASFVTSPLDMAKLRLQVQRAGDAAGAGAAGATATAAGGGAPLGFRYRNIVHGLRSIVAQEGWAALFRGAGARVAFHAPSTALTMTLFERCKAAYAGWLAPPPPPPSLLGGHERGA